MPRSRNTDSVWSNSILAYMKLSGWPQGGGGLNLMASSGMRGPKGFSMAWGLEWRREEDHASMERRRKEASLIPFSLQAYTVPHLDGLVSIPPTHAPVFPGPQSSPK